MTGTHQDMPQPDFRTINSGMYSHPAIFNFLACLSSLICIASAAGFQDPDNSHGKRKGGTACRSCRARKVRCDRAVHGAPCTNCRLDDTRCQVTTNKWRTDKRYYCAVTAVVPIKHSDHYPETTRRNILGREAVQRFSNKDPNGTKTPDFRSISNQHGYINGAEKVVNDEERMDYQLVGCSDQNQDKSQDIIEFPLMDISLAIPPETLPVPSDFADSFGCFPHFAEDLFPSHRGRLCDVLEVAPLPSYIKALPESITADDIYFARQKDALSIPETILRDELIRCYVEFVYPNLPAIDIFDFLSIVDQNNGKYGRISLLLFQAVMFVGSTFIDISFLELAGYTTRKAARQALYRRVRTLYDFDFETDPIALIQSLLLMSYWLETPDDQKGPWYWTGIASSMAHTIGLDEYRGKTDSDLKQHHLRRRLWWSCFMRDRCIALGLNQPMRIQNSDYSVPMLKLEDFEIRALSNDQLKMLPNCRLIRNTVMQTDLALMAIAKVELCLCISDVLSRGCHSVLDQESVQGYQNMRPVESMRFEAKMKVISRIQLCDMKLSHWMQNLPACYHYATPTTERIEMLGESFIVQLALLHIVYWATVSALHKLLVLPSAGVIDLRSVYNDSQEIISRSRARKAALEVSRINRDLHTLSLERYLWSVSLTITFPAVMIYLLDLTSFSRSTREEALQGFCYCAEVFIKLRENYSVAEYMTSFIDSAIQKTEIDMSNLSISGNALPCEGSTSLAGTKMTVQNVSQIIAAGKVARLAKQSCSSTDEDPGIYLIRIPMQGESVLVQHSGSPHGVRNILNTELDRGRRSHEEATAGREIDLQWRDESLDALGESGGIFKDTDWMVWWRT